MRRAIVGLLTGALLLAGIVGVRRATPGVDEVYAPIARPGEVGEQVNTTAFQIRVDRVQVGRTVRISDGYGLVGPPKTTAGVWVVVSATVAATTGALQVQGARLRTADGAEYLASSISGTLDKTDLQPGIPAYGPILFEIPPGRLAGAVLSVTTHAVKALDHLGPAADIDLGLSGVYAKRLVDHAPQSLTVGKVREL
ncbi:hypothetical protein [Sphaerisporangium perillae]|uniref:hypothetical protein n=1 Tax=Sphaerisporangium perillae TaxID=2935860 RepID=UPI00200F577F|nr:hypothetical protein [Sphaerisporangium perillae]